MQYEEERTGPDGLRHSILVLQTPSSGIDERIAALRYIQGFATNSSNKKHINARLRKSINELVLSTVLSIVMSEDRIPNLRRRQLIRAECFLILGTLLGSNTLFGNVKEKLDEIEANNTTRLLAEQVAAAAERDSNLDALTVDSDTDEHGRGATGMQRQSVSAGERLLGQPLQHVTPIKGQNPVRGGATRLPLNMGRRADGKGSPEVKYSSPSGSPRSSPVPADTLTRMLPPVPDGWVDPDSPTNSVTSAHSEDTFETLETDSTRLYSDGIPNPNQSPTNRKPRPRMGPPDGWVRESQESQESKAGSPAKRGVKVWDSPGEHPRDRSPPKGSHGMQVGIMSQSLSRLSNDLAYSRGGLDLSLINPVIGKQPRKLIKNKKLHPRPSGFMSGAYELDNFAPGVDPTDWFEQDKRLGYQKPRMFFPVPGAGPRLDRMLVPGERKSQGAELKVEDIVQEFLQMRAMLSYVGDMIQLPYSDKRKKITKTEDGMKALAVEGHFGDKSAKPLRRLAGVLDEGRYEAAVQQAMSVWSPLVGANLPRWAKGEKDERSAHYTKLVPGQPDPTKFQASVKLGDSYGNVPLERDPWEPIPHKLVQTGLNVIPHASDLPDGADAERAVLITKKMLRSLIRKEGVDRQRTHAALSQTMDLLAGNDYISRSAVEERQAAMLESLNEQQKTILDEMNVIRQLSIETAKAQYATLPKRYLLLIEGKKANPRALISKMTDTFCRVRSRNWLVLAFGTWKAHLILAESKRRAPIYARVAACYLMKEWATNRKLKQMKKQLRTWTTNIAKMIFAQRNKSVLPIQTLYRRYRDRCLLLRMHAQGIYDGPLSDIELGPERDLRFKVPTVIRTTRRDIWAGVVKIQTNFRRWSVFRHTLKRRQQVILMQSVIRMFPVRERFKRLKRHTVRMQAYARRCLARNKWCYMKIQTVVIQKYARRYLGILWKWRLFHKAWRITEKRMGAVILIQCRWREYKARKRISNIKKNRAERQWAALVLQRIWFKKKRAFHTFVLMCCLRAAEIDEVKFDELITWRERYFCARAIQRVYAIRFFRRNVTAAVKIQCKYRGYYGVNLMEMMRRERWACRRLCHWARGALRRKMKRVRQIQRCWWNYKRGHLMKHLAYTACLQDEKVDRIRKEKRYLAACRIQALVLGIWARRWAKRTRAAKKIQKPARLYIARAGWKRQLRMRNRRGIVMLVEKMVLTQVKTRVKLLVKLHSKMLIKPQALIRGFSIRNAFQAAALAAQKYGNAVLRIQRCWRSNGAMAQAVAEVMSRRRAATNPFRDCSSIHKLLQMYFKMAEKLYSTRDPRAGMKVSALLYRLGLSHLIPMFPPRQFASVTDLKELDLVMLEEMYQEWQSYEEKKIMLAGGKPSKRKLLAPTEHFRYLLSVAAPPLVPRGPSDIALVQLAQHYTELSEVSPNAASQDVQIRFIKKFGHSQSARALNIGDKVKHNWHGYNNYKALGTVFTPGMFTRALDDTLDGSAVWGAIQAMMARTDEKEMKREFEWDKKRIAECMELSQLAIEQARVIILGDRDEEDARHDPIMKILDKAFTRVMSFRKKFTYMRDKMVNEKTVHATEPAQDGHNNVTFHWAMPDIKHHKPLDVSDSVDLPFTGAQIHFDLEMNLSILKIYQEAFNQLYTASSGVQGLKTKWFIITVRKAIRNARTAAFLRKKTDEYMHQRHGDHVTDNWLRFRRADAVARKFQAIFAEMEENKRIIKEVLTYIPRYGWKEEMDDQGYAYYADTLDRDLDPTYDMPRYEPEHWKAVSRLQRRARILIEVVRERRRVKEEARIREMAAIEEKWMEEILKGKNCSKLSLCPRSNNIRSKLLTRTIAVLNTEEAVAAEMKRKAEEMKWRHENPGQMPPAHLLKNHTTPIHEDGAPDQKANSSGVDASLFAEGSEQAVHKDSEHASLDMELERSIPWRLRFEERPALVTGMWALLRTEIKPPKGTGEVKIPDGDKPHSGKGTARSNVTTAKKRGYGNYGKYGKATPDPGAELFNPYLVRSGEYSYEAVVIFKMRKAPKKKNVETASGSKTPAVPIASEHDGEEDQWLCDAKNYLGVRHVAISTTRIFLMNIEIGSKVECRYQKTVHFYRGKVTSIYENHLLNIVYSVLYDDGESEHKVSREMLRPSPDELARWFDERNAHLKDAVITLTRRRHYASMRQKREENKLDKAFYTLQTYLENNPEPRKEDARASAAPTAKSAAKGDKPQELTRDEQKQKDAEEAAAAAAAEESRLLKRNGKLKESIDAAFGDEHYGDIFHKAEESEAVSVKLTKLPFRYGWIEVITKGEDGAPDTVVYKNNKSGKVTDKAPNYRPQHDFSARKLQANWKIRRSRKYFKRLLASEPLTDIIDSAVKRYQQFAWIGYEQEGITAMMMIRRMGFYSVADCIEEKYKHKKDQLKSLTLQGIIGTPPDLYERLGIVGMDKIKIFKEFQGWYSKTPPFLREKNSQLFNFYYGVDDRRTLQEVIAAGEPYITERFLKLFPQGAARTQKSTRQVAASLYPHTVAQIDAYLRKYGDKADLARENIAELIDKKTTCQWQEEKESYQILWGATRRLKTLIGGLKVKQIQAAISAAEEEAIEAMSSITGVSPAARKAAESAKQKKLTAIRKGQKQQDDEEQKKAKTATKANEKEKDNGEKKKKEGRDNCSGPEARAALILRVKVMKYMKSVLWAVAILQRRLRGFTKKSSVWKVINKRRKSIALMQRSMRGCMDRIIAADLRQQQKSPWEQLWDQNRELVYYYNRSTGKSTYLEPSAAYRPLVRDRLSQALIQAWPFIDSDRENSAKNDFGLPPGLATFAPSLAMCCICQVRKCTRLCSDCGATNSSAGPNKMGPVQMPYCFPCFTISHNTDDTENHRFTDAAEQSRKSSGGLVCCVCADLPATRKCQGILDDRQIDELCSVLQRSVSKLWPDILAKANVGGERKLSMMLEGIMGSSSETMGSSLISPAQLQQVRMMLERTRAECDEVYCDECYKEMHSGGKRALHKWIGFQSNAPVCTVCTRSPAEVICKECDNSIYCNSCFKVFHSMGRKRKHRHSPLQEELEYGQTFCLVCSRRAGTVLCQNIIGKGDEARCSKRHCESCHECAHKQTCDVAARELAEKDLVFLLKRGQAPPDPNLGDTTTTCCLCGEEADQKCVQCGDLYCSRTWMGNPGCFTTCHTKGEKLKHKTVTLASLKPAAPPPGGYAQFAKPRKA